MKKLLLTIVTVVALTLGVQAQTNVTSPFTQVYNAIKASSILQATNYAFEPYATYAPSIKAPNKVGGGFQAIYNLNSYVGAGLGVDYLGQFSLVSGNATIKYPINVGKYINQYAPFLPVPTNLIATPFVLGGIGTSMSGGTPTVSTIEDTGVYFQFGNLWGGKFNVGVCYGQWDNAGDYSGHRYHAFAGWSHGF